MEWTNFFGFGGKKNEQIPVKGEEEDNVIEMPQSDEKDTAEDHDNDHDNPTSAVA